MDTLKAEHLGSGREAKHWPKPTLPEYAFIGRSNVGKSSLVNMLCGINKLARVSNTPGKTRNVEHFKVENAWLLADLPGYGFAKTSQTERAAWRTMIDNYLLERENLQCVFVLIDVRLEPQSNDLGMIRWLGEKGIPFVLVFTKADKLTRAEATKALSIARLQAGGGEARLFSAVKRQGIAEVARQIWLWTHGTPPAAPLEPQAQASQPE